MLSLVRLFGPRYLGLTCSDRPDLQDDENGIGIEVTRAISENKVDAHALINDIAGKPVMKVDLDDLRQGHFDALPIDTELRKQFYHYVCLK